AMAPLPTDNIALLGTSMARAIAASEAKKAEQRAAAAAEAAKNGEADAEAPPAPSGPNICPNG
ncbi:MAG: hypothetical protein ACK40O_07210, partial [Allosphingosinicella sp.]